jgi:hypothetical protein
MCQDAVVQVVNKQKQTLNERMQNAEYRMLNAGVEYKSKKIAVELIHRKSGKGCKKNVFGFNEGIKQKKPVSLPVLLFRFFNDAVK